MVTFHPLTLAGLVHVLGEVVLLLGVAAPALHGPLLAFPHGPRPDVGGLPGSVYLGGCSVVVAGSQLSLGLSPAADISSPHGTSAGAAHAHWPLQPCSNLSTSP